MYLAFMVVLFIASLFTVACAYVDMKLLTSNVIVDFAKDWIKHNKDIYRFALIGWAGIELVCILIGISYRHALCDKLIDKNGKTRLNRNNNDDQRNLLNYNTLA